MTIRNIATLWLSLSLLLVPAAFAETIPFDLEAGFRWLDVEGNEEMYRSQINEQEGFLIRSFTLNTVEFGESRLLDHLRIDAGDLGTGPAGFLRIDGGRSELYRLRILYREADLFSALPTLANPLLDQGILPGQHTIDRTRRTLDVDLELLRWGSITPFVGYSTMQVDGPGTTTYAIGGDEFLLRSDLEETDSELRAGFAFNFGGKVYGSVTQGWRSLEGEETLTLAPGAGAGNNPGSVLGRPISADGLTRFGETNVDTPFTNVFVTGSFGGRVRLIGDYVSFDADSDGVENETAVGSFVSFPLRRFFDGLDETVTSNAQNQTWRGGLRAEITLRDNVDLLAGFQQRNRELEGSALINSLYLETLPFGGVTREDLEELLRTENSLEREEDRMHVGIRARAMGPFSLWGFYRETSQDLTVTPDLAEIVIPGAQGGSFERTIDTFDVGASWAAHGFSVVASFGRDEADEPVLRTDYLDRDRTRIRASWTSPARRFRVGVTSDQTDQSNERAGIGYDSEVRQLAGDVEVALVDAFRFWASWADFQADSTILIRRPENFVVDTSVYAEDGQSLEGGFRLFVKKVSVDASFGRFENEGSNPFDIDRFSGRLGYDLTDRYGLAGEWSRDEYDETLSGLGSYRADRFGVYLRFRR